MVSLSDPAVATIPVRESGEPLADLRTVAALRLDSRLADEEGLYARLRIGVVDRLVTAQTLLPAGLRLLIVEGYRPPAESSEELRTRSPHVTGAAVDLSLCTMDEVELDLGTAVGDTATERCHTEDPAIGADARRNREILAAALRAAGLVNYPAEWWHWSYGDRYWAYVTGSQSACYGPASP
ncbi:M15 family metallopeptidase [Lentzea sp. E54]|uniref:M15 family metallopeptidase n=1 Tax=Lentzea xerophila TaxID=3435883 RepID=UPI003DA3D898